MLYLPFILAIAIIRAHTILNLVEKETT